MPAWSIQATQARDRPLLTALVLSAFPGALLGHLCWWENREDPGVLGSCCTSADWGRGVCVRTNGHDLVAMTVALDPHPEGLRVFRS